jgi:hypothetical protein
VIRMDLSEIGWGVECIHLAQDRDLRGLLWMRWWTFGFWRNGVSSRLMLSYIEAVQKSEVPQLHIRKNQSNIHKVIKWKGENSSVSKTVKLTGE